MRPKSVATEVGVFAVFMALVLAVPAYQTLTGLQRAPALLGLPRSAVIGVPLALIAASFALSGLALLVSRSQVAVIACMATAAGLGVAFVVFGLITVPGMLTTPIAFAVYAIPVLVVIRGRKAIAELDSQERSPAAKERA